MSVFQSTLGTTCSVAAPSAPAPPQVTLPRSHRRRVLKKKTSLLHFHTLKVTKMDGEQKVERGRVIGGGYIRSVS